jgi:hypothetical protein
MPLFLGWRLGTRHAITLGSAQIHPQAAIQTMLTELTASRATVSPEGLGEAVCNRTSLDPFWRGSGGGAASPAAADFGLPMALE